MSLSWVERLKNEIGASRVIDDEEEVAAHSYDSWPVAAKWRRQGKRPYSPNVVVRPEYADEVSRLLAWASANDVPVTPWGAGSSVTGAPLPTRGGISLDLCAMRNVLALDEANLLVRVEAGMPGHKLEGELNARGYTLNHSPQSLHLSTVGGWIATRATGHFSSRWGGIENLIVALTVVLPTGELVETKPAPRAAIGPELRELFVGSEGTLGVVTDVTLKIFPMPERRLFATVSFERIDAGVAAVRRIMRLGLRPFLVRLYDEDETRHLIGCREVPGDVLLLGFEGVKEIAKAERDVGIGICRAEGGRVLGAQTALAWMERRFDFSAVEDLLGQPGGVAETIEVAHFWDSILATYNALKQALAPLATDVLSHFSHVYPQGTSLYMTVLGRVEDDAAAEERLLQIWDVAMNVCLEHGAAISHHHGVGLARLPYIRRELGASGLVLERIKEALDPAGILNPGKFGLGQEQQNYGTEAHRGG
jgi:alkyldihydroxyacetonephosphate synthase